MRDVRNPIRRLRPAARKGFTLLEAMFATSILFAVVVSVTAAITAGQQHAYEAHQRVAAVLAAESMMNRIIADDYDRMLNFNGQTEAVGQLRDENNNPLPATFDSVGRQVEVVTELQSFADPVVVMRGRRITVRTFDVDGRVLVELERFVPEPAEQAG